jgi:Tfp pilus assembly protein PilF
VALKDEPPMSVYRTILGRELPCTIGDLLRLPRIDHTSDQHERLLRAASSTASHAGATDFYRLGASHLSRGELGLARARLGDAVRQSPDHSHARLALAAAHESLAEHDRAAAQIDAVLATLDESSDAAPSSRYHLHCAAGLSLERDGDWRTAKARYVSALSARPTDALAMHRLIAIHLSHKEIGEAAACLTELLKHHPQDQAARICLAHLLQLLGRPGEAVWEYEQTVCLSPDSWDLSLDAASEMQLLGAGDDALGVLEQLVGAQPHFPDLRMRLADLYARRGDDDAARAEYHNALALHPDYLDCHVALSLHELRAGRTDVAAEHLRQAIAINDQNVEAYAGLALALHALNHTARANEMLASAGRIANNSALFTARLAALDAGDVHRAAAVATEALEVQVEQDQAVLMEHDNLPPVRLRHAMLLRLLGRAEEAWQSLRHAVRDDPSCERVWIQVALTRADQWDTREAMRAIERSLAFDCDRARALYDLGLLYCGQTEFDLAMEQWTEAQGADADRLIWSMIDDLHLLGPTALRTAVPAGAAAIE